MTISSGDRQRAVAALSETIRQLEDGAPRLFSKWSPRAWRLACEGPAVRLWDALAKNGAVADGSSDPAFGAYLYLLREAVGLQYISASAPEDLEASPGSGGFLAVALCDLAPRLLPPLSPAGRALALAQLWNVGEKLAAQPVWLNRYLTARLGELESLGDFEDFLRKVVREGLDPVRRSQWKGPFTAQVIDPTPFDRTFLPGAMHLATPSVVCVHDVRRPERHVAILLRPQALCLGATPCLGKDGAPDPVRLGGAVDGKVFQASGLAERTFGIATEGGFAVFASPLSQRLWVVVA